MAAVRLASFLLIALVILQRLFGVKLSLEAFP